MANRGPKPKRGPERAFLITLNDKEDAALVRLMAKNKVTGRDAIRGLILQADDEEQGILSVEVAELVKTRDVLTAQVDANNAEVIRLNAIIASMKRVIPASRRQTYDEEVAEMASKLRMQQP